MKLVVIDGQSGRTGALLVERIRAAGLPLELLAVGTNAIATAAMMKAGAQRGATGENPVLVACRDADIIAGPIGILMADALMGEITPAMARKAFREPTSSSARKPSPPMLIPSMGILCSAASLARCRIVPSPPRVMTRSAPFNSGSSGLEGRSPKASVFGSRKGEQTTV